MSSVLRLGHAPELPGISALAKLKHFTPCPFSMVASHRLGLHFAPATVPLEGMSAWGLSHRASTRRSRHRCRGSGAIESLLAMVPCLALRYKVWRARLWRFSEKRKDQLIDLELDINVLPPVMPKRMGSGTSSTSNRVWRKIVYWARLHDRGKFGTINRLSPDRRHQNKERIAVLGGGAFGTAMAAVAARNGYPTLLVIRDKNVRDFINQRHINPNYLAEFDLPPNLTATTDAAVALASCTMLIHAVPVQASRQVLQSVKRFLPKGVPVVAISKGVELGTLSLMCDLIPEALERTEAENPVVVVSGPSFAREIMDRRPTSVVAASKTPEAAARVQQILTASYFRVSVIDDVIGVEVAGALKNVLAIAAGICEGLGLGLNAMSALVTQGTAEIRWLATKMGGKPQTLSGVSGMGDILLTCFGSLSRNRTVGVRLGRGESFEAVVGSGNGVAEGVYTARMVVELSDRYKVLLPVLTTVARILDREVSPVQAVFEVLSLPALPETA